MDTLLPRTLLALCLLMSACTEKTPPLSGERLEKYNALRAQGGALRDKEGHLKALATYEQALALCDKSADEEAFSDTEKEIAKIHLIFRGFEHFENEYRENLTKNDEQFGEYSEQSLDSLRSLSVMLWKQGKWTETESGLLRLVAAAEVLLGRHSPEATKPESDVWRLSHNLGLLGNFLAERGRHQEAESALRRCFQLGLQVLRKTNTISDFPIDPQINIYRNVLLKMGDTEEQAKEKIDKMMEPLSKK